MNYPVPTPIYHITHINNLQGILQSGGLWATNYLSSPHQSVAYGHIQSRRAKRTVPLCKGGTLHDYVPFYFCPRSPMLYAIHCPSPGQMQYQGGQRSIIHLVSTADAVANAGLDFTFTDRHAVLGYVSFFDQLTDLSNLCWPYIQATTWNNNSAHPDRKERKQAEFLVHRFFPWSLIAEIGVYDQQIAQQVQQALNAFSMGIHPAVQIKRNWYY